MEESKPFWKSKTLWVNAIVAALGLVSSDTVSEHPEAAAGFVAFINVVLRLVTKGSVALS
jgi:hypothetical protein